MFVRMYTGPDGRSHLEDFSPPTGTGSLPLEKGQGGIFRRYAPGPFVDWHPAPYRLYMFTLQGGMEIVVGDGAVRRFAPGDVLLAEDLTGQGHTTRSIGQRVAAIVPLGD